jgi:hypothetical protein
MASGWNFEICAHLEMKTVYLAEAAVEESSALSCIAKSSSTSSLSQSSAQYCFSSVSSFLSIHPSCISTGLGQYIVTPDNVPLQIPSGHAPRTSHIHAPHLVVRIPHAPWPKGSKHPHQKTSRRPLFIFPSPISHLQKTIRGGWD